jgi:hypothetical protein
VPTRVAIGLLLLAFASPAAAQRGGPQLDVSVIRSNSPPAGASVRASGLLRDSKTRELLLSGFPAALRFRLELWRAGGLFDELESSANWEVYVRYDPYTQQYALYRRGNRTTEDLSGFATLEAAESELAKAYAVPLPPAREGQRYYYNLVVDVETLSVSDLNELERWLRGDLQPAVRGRRDPFTALRRGIGTLLSRVLGGDKRHYESRTGTFVS